MGWTVTKANAVRLSHCLVVRNIPRRIGFTSKPILRTFTTHGNGHLLIRNFQSSLYELNAYEKCVQFKRREFVAEAWNRTR